MTVTVYDLSACCCGGECVCEHEDAVTTAPFTAAGPEIFAIDCDGDAVDAIYEIVMTITSGSGLTQLDPFEIPNHGSDVCNAVDGEGVERVVVTHWVIRDPDTEEIKCEWDFTYTIE